MGHAGLASGRVGTGFMAEIGESGARLCRGLAPGIPLGGRMPTAPPRGSMARSASGSLRDRRTVRGPLSRLGSAQAQTFAALVLIPSFASSKESSTSLIDCQVSVTLPAHKLITDVTIAQPTTVTVASY